MLKFFRCPAPDLTFPGKRPDPSQAWWRRGWRSWIRLVWRCPPRKANTLTISVWLLLTLSGCWQTKQAPRGHYFWSSVHRQCCPLFWWWLSLFRLVQGRYLRLWSKDCGFHPSHDNDTDSTANPTWGQRPGSANHPCRHRADSPMHVQVVIVSRRVQVNNTDRLDGLSDQWLLWLGGERKTCFILFESYTMFHLQQHKDITANEYKM